MKRGEGPTKEWDLLCMTCGSPRKSEVEEEEGNEVEGTKSSKKSKSEAGSVEEEEAGIWRWVSFKAKIE